MEKLVWAKLGNHPYWPARVVERPKELLKYSKKKQCVLFFGTSNYGFVDPNNILDYAENRHKFVLSNRTRSFEIAVTEIDALINSPNQPSQPKPVDGFVRVKTEPDNGRVQIDTVNISTQSKPKSQDDVHKELSKQILELKSTNDDMFFELQKTKESLKLLQTEKFALKAKNAELEQTLGELTNQLNDIESSNKQLKSEKQKLKAAYEELQSAVNQKDHDEALSETSGSYEVDQILDHKMVRKVMKFLVRWTGYDASHDCWVSEKDLACPEILSRYKESRNLK